jgi:hypothetical protein
MKLKLLLILLGQEFKTRMTVKLSEITISVKDWSADQLKLRETILKGGFIDGYEDKYPLITRDYVCLDGNHRLWVLDELHGGDYEVTVDRQWYVKWRVYSKLFRNQKFINNKNPDYEWIKNIKVR